MPWYIAPAIDSKALIVAIQFPPGVVARLDAVASSPLSP